MSFNHLTFLLLAQIQNWRRLGDGLRNSRTRIDPIDLLPYAVIAASLGGGIAAFAAWRRRNDFTRRTDDPQKLFREMCVIHELDRGSQQLLRQLAKELELRQPAQVFLTPSAFQKPGLPEALHSKADDYASLRQRLF